jgi:hypothetical protein
MVSLLYLLPHLEEQILDSISPFIASGAQNEQRLFAEE